MAELNIIAALDLSHSKSTHEALGHCIRALTSLAERARRGDAFELGDIEGDIRDRLGERIGTWKITA